MFRRALAALALIAPVAITPVDSISGQPAAECADCGLDWRRIIELRLAPLARPHGTRWPLILWEGLEDIDDAVDVRMLLARGLVPHVRLDARFIERAKRIQSAGSPVIIMEGRSGRWPYHLAGAASEWAHRYPPGNDVAEAWRGLPSPSRFRGWAVAAEGIRQTLGQFRDAGVRVDAVWLDYEGEPSTSSYGAALASADSAALIPAEALRDADSFHGFRRQLWAQLLSAYVAGPVREIFPGVSVTNWVSTVSTGERPVLDWYGRPHPATAASLFTHSNPVAYAIDTAYLAGAPAADSAGRARIDRRYAHIMLRQVSADAYNRSQSAPYLGAVVWVARWVPDVSVDSPAMSRGHYREILRHLWLRGIDAMQVFNPVRPGYEQMAVAEVVDAARVYAQMLSYGEFLEAGEVLNYDYPGPESTAPLWSGLRLGDRAVIRVTAGPEAGRTVSVSPWAGDSVRLAAPAAGRTYLLHHRDHGIDVRRVGFGAPQ